MARFVLREAGTYHVWAIAEAHIDARVVIRATGAGGEPLGVTVWSFLAPLLPGMPVNWLATSGEIRDMPAGTVVSTDPALARLRILRCDDASVIYDSVYDQLQPRHVPAPRYGGAR